MAESLPDRAQRFAEKAHAGQKRKYTGAPYVVHPGRVAQRVAGLGLPETAVAAAWLHDTVEDCGVSIEALRSEFGGEVAGLVDHLTNRSKGLGLHRAARKKMDRERLSRIPMVARIIKAVDRLDNLGDLATGDPAFRRMYASESVALADALAGETEGTAAEKALLAGLIVEMRKKAAEAM